MQYRTGFAAVVICQRSRRYGLSRLVSTEFSSLVPRGRDRVAWRPHITLSAQWEPRHFRVTGTCSKCGESIYAGQHRTRWRYQYPTYRCPDAETNAVIRALAPEHDWINAPEPPTRN